MTYLVGDVIIYKKESHYGIPITAIVANIADTITWSETIFHVFTKNGKYEQTKQKYIISLGDPDSIITNDVISEVLKPNQFITEFSKCVLFHLIRSTDKYDLQILNNCISMINGYPINLYEYEELILGMIHTKIKDTNIQGVI